MSEEFYEGDENYDGAYYNEEDFYEGDEFYGDENYENEIYDDEMTNEPSVEFEVTYEEDPRQIQLLTMVQTFKAFIFDSIADFNIVNSTIEIELPRSILPLSLQCVYGFLVDDILFKVHLELNSYRWDILPKRIQITHPFYGEIFVGKALMAQAANDFFSVGYKPRNYYRCSKFILCSSTQADRKLMRQLMEKEHLSEQQAQRALSLCKNDYRKAAQLMRTGEIPPGIGDNVSPQQFASYSQNPLLYLIIELCECLFDLQDHCCLCRKRISRGLKPAACNNDLCKFQFSTIGIGVSVVSELKRDPRAADLLISIFSAAFDTQFCTPAPDDFTTQEIRTILNSLPPCQEMATFQTDQALASLISLRGLQLVRWILLSCRSHLISLPPEMEIPMFKGSQQFMTLVSSPEAEGAFQSLKETYKGSIFLFHGSHAERWHSIIRNGLKNATGTKLQANGSALGDGIYFAKESGTSWGYSHSKNNLYKSSIIGKSLHIISLCEIANLPMNQNIKVKYPVFNEDGSVTYKESAGFLKDHGWAHTLTIEEACIVRFLFVGGNFNVNALTKPPKNVPSLKSVLDYQMRKYL
ncbi:UBA/TS-N domain containing protein [Histomonas meleagridis]|uniref:UBA/TS-N domain containing protein n=1 Tax=Histomonas meleagridis TaxID=135588 RepID=UPI00355983B1|nr:UBA/TS-N domain containing protein [Histomonas meleagridis]KAH0807169.1 UBA/TS-N domain containing protein [Histomonas meleagridis]